jgi:threonine dehydratase
MIAEGGPPSLTVHEIEAAARRIEQYVVRTPVLDGSTLEIGPLRLKAEGLQRTGSFKVRGAFNAVLQLAAGQRAAGVITLSAGNHGMALALAARTLGVRCVVVIPDDAPGVKVEAIAQAGAELIPVPRAQLGTRVDAERERAGLTLVHPFDDPEVIAGQGTVGLEVLEVVPDLGTIVVPVGGGGLIAGIAVAVKALRPSVRVIGVEPKTAAAVSASLRAGRLIAPERLDSVADGLAPPYTRSRNLDLIRRFVDEMVQVSDDEILAAVARVTTGARLIVEPSGAAAVAAVMSGAAVSPSGPLVAVLSGSNIDPARLAGWLTAIKRIPGLTHPGT